MRIDDLLAQNPGWAPWRPRVGFAPKLSDAELVTLAVISALLGFDNESQFMRFAHEHLGPWFPYLPDRAGYNKRLRRSAEMIAGVMGCLARECDSFHDDVWLADSTPVECGTSRETQKRSGLAGWAEYGYCASHSRYFWGLRLHLIATPAGLPIAFALAGAKADERDVCADMVLPGPQPEAADPQTTPFTQTSECHCRVCRGSQPGGYGPVLRSAMTPQTTGRVPVD